MRSAYRFPADRRPALGRRAVAFTLAVAIELLIAFVLLTLGDVAPRPVPAGADPVTFAIDADRPATPRAQPRVRVATRNAAERQAPPAGTPPPPPPVPVPRPDTPPPWSVLLVTGKDYAAADIGKLPSRPGTTESGERTAVVEGGGAAGANGNLAERLFDADWDRKPTRAELATYLPARARTGTALIACQTIAGNRVDNCRSLGETPPGSGLALGLREAAWQFRILPPRVGGRPILGAWVRIRFDLTVGVPE